MPDATITSTESTFGTISGTFAADQSTITGTVSGVITGTLSGSVGVPGPAGAGLPTGGTEGQIIVKASATDYDTVWADNAAETLTATVRNETGATLSKGTVVYITGAAGNKALVSKASASAEATSSKTFAILAADILNNQNGTAVTVGLLKGLDTSGLTEGGSLWLSTTAGEWTQTMPTAPNHAVFLGTVTRVHATQGTVEVRIQNGYELQELHNVKITSVSNGQVLKYDSAQGLWVNGTDAGGAVWGGITGTLSSQTDLQSALDGKYSTTNPAGYITSSALSGYATESFVTSQGYITSSALTPYLSKADNLASVASVSVARDNLGLGSLNTPVFSGVTAQGSGSNVANLTPTSLSLTHATSGSFTIQPSVGITFPDSSVQTTAYTGPAPGYITSVSSPLSVTSGNLTIDLSAYLTTSSASATYYPLTNPSGYITSSALTGYATESWVTAGFYPLTGNPSGFLTSASLSGYATESWVTSQLGSYLTTSSAASTYLTQSNAASTYQTISGMSSYLTTSAAASTYQTQAGMSSYLTTSTAASTYAPKASPALTGNVTITTNSTSPALFIEQTGTGNILTLHDQASDTTFVAIDQNGKVGTIASTTANAGFNIPHGTAPTSPVNGDVWTTTSGLLARINGSTRQYVDLDGTQTINGAKTFSGANQTLGNSTAAGTINVGTGATISGSTKTVNIGTAGVAGSTTNINIGSAVSGATSTATINALLLTRASATTGSGLRIPHGTAPTSPTNGDVWTDTAGFYARINGATVTLTPPTAATVAEAKAGTDTAKFINSNVLQKVVNSPSYYKFPRGLLTGSTSGTGASVASGALITNVIGTSTGAGWAQYKYYGLSGIDIVNATGWAVGGQSINFAKKFRITGSTNMLGALPTNTIVRVMFGKNANDGGGDPTQRCIGWRYNQATGFIEIIAHNGTTLSTLTTSSNPAAGSWFEWELYNDGAGNVQMFVNDTSIGTVTGGPVSLDFGSAPTYVEEVQCTATPSAQPQVRFRNGGLFMQP